MFKYYVVGEIVLIAIVMAAFFFMPLIGMALCLLLIASNFVLIMFLLEYTKDLAEKNRELIEANKPKVIFTPEEDF